MSDKIFDNDLAQIACGLTDFHLNHYKAVKVHQNIVSDLEKLVQCAKKAGFELAIASAHRDFERQMHIWNSKFLGNRAVFNNENQVIDMSKLSELDKCHAIMLFSALPGASRHHFGTDLDIYALNCLNSEQQLQLAPWEYQLGGPFYQFNNWLDENLETYGFYRPYAYYNGGVAAEPWHISHINTAMHLEKEQNIDNLNTVISQFDVAGQDTILANLSDLYTRYISNIALP
jgi:LAS superfamily LD-carboxypeptidase LdcB